MHGTVRRLTRLFLFVIVQIQERRFPLSTIAYQPSFLSLSHVTWLLTVEESCKPVHSLLRLHSIPREKRYPVPYDHRRHLDHRTSTSQHPNNDERPEVPNPPGCE